MHCRRFDELSEGGFDTQTLRCANLLFPQRNKKNGWTKWTLFVLKNRLSAVIFEKDDLANITNRFFTKQCWLNVAQNAIKTVHRINLFGTRSHICFCRHIRVAVFQTQHGSVLTRKPCTAPICFSHNTTKKRLDKMDTVCVEKPLVCSNF